MKNIILIVAIAVASYINIYSAEITGRVFGEDENRKPVPLQNARIVSTPSKTGVMSDKNGKFKFSPANGDTELIISYIGYSADTLIISEIENNKDLSVYLSSNIVLETLNVDGAKSASTLTFSDGVRIEGISSRGLLKAACCNLSESFTTSPSVDVEYSDAVTGAKRIQLLGLQSTYSQILSENVPIMRGLASTYGFALFPGQWLESISIAKGSSVKWIRKYDRFNQHRL